MQYLSIYISILQYLVSLTLPSFDHHNFFNLYVLIRLICFSVKSWLILAHWSVLVLYLWSLWSGWHCLTVCRVNYMVISPLDLSSVSFFCFFNVICIVRLTLPHWQIVYSDIYSHFIRLYVCESVFNLMIGLVLVLNLIVRCDHITLIYSNHYFFFWLPSFFLFLLSNHNFFLLPW